MAALESLPDSFQQQVLHQAQRLQLALTEHANTQAAHHKWLDLLINRTIADESFRIQALRFIDVLPALDDDDELAAHLQEYFADLELPRFAEWGLRHSDTPWATRIAAPTVRYTLRGLARKFMGGSQLHHALTAVNRLRHQGMNFTLDLLGEATISETEAAEYQQQYIQMLENLAEPINNWSTDTLLDRSHGLDSPRLNLSIKLSSLYSQIRPVAPEFSIQAILNRLRPVVRLAQQRHAFITIDMEQYDFKHIVLDCFKTLVMEDEFRQWPHIGIAMQAYLKDTYSDLEDLLELARKRNTPFTIRLVRGAYWDYETVIARQNNWPCPVWENKSDTDLNYEKCLQLLLTNHKTVHCAIATHNARSIAFTLALCEQLSLKTDEFEFQMLFGMANPYKHALQSLGYGVRVYVPFGETLPGMAYLVRRLLENSSGQSLLDSGFGSSGSIQDDSIFDIPVLNRPALKLQSVNKENFNNTPLLRFTSKTERDEFQHTLKLTEESLGKDYGLYINGKWSSTESFIDSVNPSHPEQLVGRVSQASHAHADIALQAATEAFSEWSTLPVRQRADTLRRVANQLKKQRMRFAALQVFEAGKSWQEADADVCEAIDFLLYYAMQAERLFSPSATSVSGEDNQLSYHGRGVSLIIAPWNFPLAILCGMMSAAIVCGNTCIVKPSSLTPVVAAEFISLWHQLDLPAGVINFLPGSGKVVAEYLARKPETHIIAFTGSLQVGTQLLQTGAQIQPGQRHIKKVIAEMGGKNAIVIDADADLDDAVTGTLHSAFGYQGQKCSAASRVIVVETIYQRFVSRLLEAAKSLQSGPAESAENFIGPVIDEVAYRRILDSIEHARQISTMHQFNENLPESGFFIPPTIFTDVDPQSPLAQEEIFGPVLAVIKASSFENAITIANNTRYALTGGLYSRQPSHLLYARQHFDVGNLYLNRKTTGAIVGRQPFGGHRMSGAGSKAGGVDYLMHFVDCRCVTENTLRRGFAPQTEDD